MINLDTAAIFLEGFTDKIVGNWYIYSAQLMVAVALKTHSAKIDLIITYLSTLVRTAAAHGQIKVFIRSNTFSKNGRVK